MKKILILLIGNFLLLATNTMAQSKKSIDFTAIDQWPLLSRPNITADGKYAGFLVENGTAGNMELLLSAIDGSWTKKIVVRDPHYIGMSFTNDSKFAVFQTGDSIGILELGTNSYKFIPEVDRFEQVTPGLPYIVYATKGDPELTVFYDPATERQLLSRPMGSRILSPDNTILAYTIPNGTKQQLHWYDLTHNKDNVIASAWQISNLKFDKEGKQLAFIASQDSGSKASIYLFRHTDTMAKPFMEPDAIPLQGNFRFWNIDQFSNDGKRLFCDVVEEPSAPNPLRKLPGLDVWNFNDPVMQPMQVSSFKARNDILAVLDLTRNKLDILGYGKHLLHGILNGFSDEWRLFFKTNDGYFNEGYWNQLATGEIIAVNTQNGKQRLITGDLNFAVAQTYWLSPDGKFILYFDNSSGDYFSYCLDDGRKVNLTGGKQLDFSGSSYCISDYNWPGGNKLAGWVATRNGFEVLLKDKKGIWRCSIDGKIPPVCITFQGGEWQRLDFNQVKTAGIFIPDVNTVYEEGKPVLMAAFDPETKQNGFYSVDLSGKLSPQKLFMGDYAFQVPITVHSWGFAEIVKAGNADIYLVARQSSKESRNYFITKDFKTFTGLTSYYPEKQYNWLTTELVKWKLPDGRTSKGILYKPENFDPARKYPIIFHYYEKMSDNLNVFLRPNRSLCPIDVPYYVSNGYLVFTPDIECSKAGAGVDALNTMVSAAKHLAAKYPFIDAKRMGLSGHSMGGYKTNFIITHSTLFAAADGHSGTANIASWALNLWSDGGSQIHTEIGQYYIGHSIAERPDLYVTNSPVYYVNNIQTPILMMYNKADEGPWLEGVAMFKAMRRAGKRAWMLQYDGHDHFLNEGDTLATRDWTIRQKQFYDHYLMGKPAPVWMTKGIPADRKGIDDGLELDTTIKTPVGRLLMESEKRKLSRAALRNAALLRSALPGVK
ncbi:MAG: prolyl oligopeptidase family serine peptidase [Chitinophagaceae bacterium]|nr:prolyl oligopeptidase family serine peptidase [Chitinophagaceae bacterium]